MPAAAATCLTGILRDELGFKGFVVSDWGATHSAQFLNAGLDMEMIDGPDSSGYQEPAFLGAEAAALPPPAVPGGEDMGDIYGGNIPEEPAVPPMSSADIGAKVAPQAIAEGLADGTITEAAVTRAAGRVLYEMNRFGLLDGQSRHDVTAQAIAANAEIIERTGEEAAVLLKNRGRRPALETGRSGFRRADRSDRRASGRDRHQWRTLDGIDRAPGRSARCLEEDFRQREYPLRRE